MAVKPASKCGPCGKVQLLSKISKDHGSIAAMDNQWKKIAIAIDSGACDNVINPDDAGYEMMPTAASEAGENFASATGEEIPNMG